MRAFYTDIHIRTVYHIQIIYTDLHRCNFLVQYQQARPSSAPGSVLVLMDFQLNVTNNNKNQGDN